MTFAWTKSRKRISDRKIDRSTDQWLTKDQVLFFKSKSKYQVRPTKYKLSTKYIFSSVRSITKYILQVEVQAPSKLMQVQVQVPSIFFQV